MRGADVAADEADGGAFPGAIGTEEGEDFASFDAEGDVFDSDIGAEGFCEVHGSEAIVGGGVDAFDFGGDFVIRLVGFFDVLGLVGSAADFVPDGAAVPP